MARSWAVGAALAATLGTGIATAASPGRLAARFARVVAPRDLLWRVDQACRADAALTGSAFPCLSVTAGRGGASGYAVLRPPLGGRHLVVVPTARVVGIEAGIAGAGDGGVAARAAWRERAAVDPAGRGAGWSWTGIAVNSALTRSQDQLHVHVGCVAPSVRAGLAARLGDIPEGRWLRAGFVIDGHPFWARRATAAELAGADLVAMVGEVGDLARAPGRAVFAAVGVGDGRDGDAVLLAGESDPRLDRGQFTSEHLLDYGCGAPRA